MSTPTPDKVASHRSDVFISYSRKDREFVKRLEEALESRGRETWVDWQGIRPAEEFMQAIFPAIEGTDTFIFVLSPDSVTSEICGKELAHAVSHNKRMIPIMARETDAKLVPEPLAKLNWVFARDADSFEAATEFLISALDTDLDWVRAHTRLLTRALEWEGKGKSNSFVLRGEDLRAAEQWLAQAGTEKERQPTALQTEYIIASRKAASRRQRITLGAVSFGLVVAIVLAILALIQRGEAIEQTRRATKEKERSQQIASRGDFVESTRLIAQANTTRALSYLARALELWPANHAAADRIFTLFTQRRFLLPLTDPISLKGRITCLRFTPDGRCLLVSVENQSASVWELGGGPAPLATVRSPYEIQDAQLSPDAALLATACGLVPPVDVYPVADSPEKTAGSAQVWSAIGGQALTAPLEHSALVRSVRFHPDGRQLITASEDQTAQIWRTDSGTKVGEALPLGAPGGYAAFSPDGEQVITLAQEARLWNLATKNHLRLTTGAESASSPAMAEFSADNKFVAISFSATSYDDSYHEVGLFDRSSGQPTKIDPPASGPDIPSIAFDSTSRFLILSIAGLYRNKDSIGGVEIIDTATGRNTSIESARPVNDARFGTYGNIVFFGGDDGELRVRSLEKELVVPVRFGFPVVRCEPQRGGHQLAVVFADSSQKQNFAQLFDTRTFVQHNEKVPVPDLAGRTMSLGNEDGAILDRQGNGDLFIRGFEDGTACIGRNQADRNACVRHGIGPGSAILSGKFGSRGSIFATGGGGDFRLSIGYARVWKTADHTPLTELLPHDRAVTDLDFTEDGKRLLTLSSSYPKETGFGTRVWDVETGQLLGDEKKDDIDLGTNLGARFIDGGRRVVTVSGGDGAEPMAQSWDSSFGRGESVPEWLPRLAKLISGYELPEQGEALQPIVGRAKELRVLSAKLSGDKLNDAYTRFGRWFFDRSVERKLSPYATLSVTARIEQCLKEATEETLIEAEQLANGDPRILDRIASQRREKK